MIDGPGRAEKGKPVGSPITPGREDADGKDPLKITNGRSPWLTNLFPKMVEKDERARILPEYPWSKAPKSLEYSSLSVQTEGKTTLVPAFVRKTP